MFGFLIPHSNHFSPHLREVQWQKCWKESGLASEQEAFAKSLNLKLIVLGMNIEVIQYPFNIMDEPVWGLIENIDKFETTLETSGITTVEDIIKVNIRPNSIIKIVFAPLTQ